MKTQIITRAQLISSLLTAIGWWLVLLFSIGWTSKKLIASEPVTIIDFVIPFILALAVVRSSRRYHHLMPHNILSTAPTRSVPAMLRVDYVSPPDFEHQAAEIRHGDQVLCRVQAEGDQGVVDACFFHLLREPVVPITVPLEELIKAMSDVAEELQRMRSR